MTSKLILVLFSFVAVLLIAAFAVSHVLSEEDEDEED